MSETIRTITNWLTTSGIKIVGILIGLIILSQMSRWIVKWMEKFVPEKDPLQATEAKKRAHTLGNILRYGLLIVKCKVQNIFKFFNFQFAITNLQ